jgi:hypothetical protein
MISTTMTVDEPDHGVFGQLPRGQDARRHELAG